MIEVKVNDATLRSAAAEGEDAFVATFIDAINAAIGGTLTNETMQQLNSDQITLLGWSYLHSEVMNGGYIQLYFIMVTAHLYLRILSDQQCAIGDYRIVFAPPSHQKSIRQVSQPDRKRNVGRDFMALYEQMPEFDDADDDFIVNEEQWTKMIAAYIDDHINNFATIEK